MAYSNMKYKHYLILLFVAVITFQLNSLHNKFNYLDLGYLIVVAITFVRFLNRGVKK